MNGIDQHAHAVPSGAQRQMTTFRQTDGTMPILIYPHLEKHEEVSAQLRKKTHDLE